jgi:hypothetical protein
MLRVEKMFEEFSLNLLGLLNSFTVSFMMEKKL